MKIELKSSKVRTQNAVAVVVEQRAEESKAVACTGAHVASLHQESKHV